MPEGWKKTTDKAFPGIIQFRKESKWTNEAERAKVDDRTILQLPCGGSAEVSRYSSDEFRRRLKDLLLLR
jgi:hypothetical protein